jgi:hypothetical protein
MPWNSVCYLFMSATIVRFICGPSNPDQGDLKVLDATGKYPPNQLGFLTACRPPPHCNLDQERPRGYEYVVGAATQRQREHNAADIAAGRLRAESSGRRRSEARTIAFVLLLILCMAVVSNKLYVVLSYNHLFQ